MVVFKFICPAQIHKIAQTNDICFINGGWLIIQIYLYMTVYIFAKAKGLVQ